VGIFEAEEPQPLYEAIPLEKIRRQ
jgi:hypothetical protein